MKSRLRLGDVLPLGLLGLRTRRVRAALCMLGIAIGIAALVGVLGIAASAQADLLAQLDRLGTNLLTVAPGQQIGGADPVPLPATAPTMIRHVDGVTGLAATAELPAVHAYRTDLVPVARSGSLAVRAVDAALPSTLDLTQSSGVFVGTGSERLPIAVLGAQAAAQLGDSGRIWLGCSRCPGHWFSIGGVLRPQPLVPEVDRSVYIGFPVAGQYFRYDGHPTLIYVRTDVERVAAVAAKLARTANPTNAFAVRVNRPSDALTARLAVARSGTARFLALGAVALLVGALGIANVMVVAVLERRPEIGLRRALGARRGHIAVQFLTEAVVLAALGGAAGVAAGSAIAAVVAGAHHWPWTVPALAVWGGPLAAVAVGAVAGLYPATRAARMSPTGALRTV